MNIDTEINLKPCPFCGGDAVMVAQQSSNAAYGFLTFDIWCNGDDDCDVVMTSEEIDFRCKIMPNPLEVITNVVNQWNKRHTSPTILSSMKYDNESK